MDRVLHIILLVFVASIFSVNAQDDDSKFFKNEIYGGFVFHTSGWGLNITHSKYLTDKSRAIFEIDFYSIKDQKEAKVKKPRTKRFIFGKLNSVYALDINYGRKRVISHDFKNKGVEVALKYVAGPSFAILKPEYILVSDPTSQTPVLERFNPTEHDIFNIYGGAPKLSGVSESSFVIGANAKVGVSFDFSPYKNYVRMIEMGIMANYYISPIVILDKSEGRTFIPNLYLNFLFGRVNK